MTERLTGLKGSMFSGKTEVLITRVTRQEIAGKTVQVFKPKIDDRYGAINEIKSHSGARHDATPVENSLQILELLDPEADLVAIDEIQFFDEQIVAVVEELLDRDVPVIFAGLPEDFRGEPFGQMPILLAKSDDIVPLTAVCDYKMDGETCGQEATKTQRFVNGEPAHYKDPIVEIGGRKAYAARCPNHHVVRGKPQRDFTNQKE